MTPAETTDAPEAARVDDGNTPRGTSNLDGDTLIPVDINGRSGPTERAIAIDLEAGGWPDTEPDMASDR